MSALRLLVLSVLCVLVTQWSACEATNSSVYYLFPADVESSAFDSFFQEFTFYQLYDINPTSPPPSRVVTQAEPNMMMTPNTWSYVTLAADGVNPNMTLWRTQLHAYLMNAKHLGVCTAPVNVTNNILSTFGIMKYGTPAQYFTSQENDTVFAIGSLGWKSGQVEVEPGVSVGCVYYGVVFSELTGWAEGYSNVIERTKAIIQAKNLTGSSRPKVLQYQASIPFVSGQLDQSIFNQELGVWIRGAGVVQPDTLLPWLTAQVQPNIRSVVPVITTSPVIIQSHNVSAQLVFAWQDGPLMAPNPSNPDIRHCVLSVVEFPRSAA